MKPIDENEDVAFNLNDGKRIKGKEVLKTKTVEVELLDGGILNEKSLMLDMEKYIKELNNE